MGRGDITRTCRWVVERVVKTGTQYYKPDVPCTGDLDGRYAEEEYSAGHAWRQEKTTGEEEWR